MLLSHMNGHSTTFRVTLWLVWLAPSGVVYQLALPVLFRITLLAPPSREYRCKTEESMFKVHMAWKG